MDTNEVGFQSELVRLRDEVHALSQANIQLQQARSYEESRYRFLELVTQNHPEERLLSSLGGMLQEQSPGLAFSFLLPLGEELRHACSIGLPDQLVLELEDLPFSTAATVCKATALKRPVLALQGSEPDQVGAGPLRQLIARYGFTSLYCSPAFNAGGRLLGMLVLYGTTPGQLEQPVLRLLVEQTTTLLSMGLNHRFMADRLFFQAHHDVLTSLPNRAFFYESLAGALSAATLDGSKVAVLWTGLDRFEQVNDTLGHRTADLLLRMAAQRVSACVGERGTVARMGGDEFVVLMGRVHDAGQPRQLADELLAAFREPFGLADHQQALSLSIGVSLFPDHGADAEELVRNADLAMYGAKRSGPNSCVVFHPATGASALESFQLEFHLRRALEHGELELYFQPLVSCKYGSIPAFEALLRWFSPALGSISPAQFIPVAEETGLIQDIGRWALNQACGHAASWQRHSPGVRVAVNVSSAQLANGDFCEIVRNALFHSGLPASLLELEITESALIPLDDLQRHTRNLRALGVTLAIDDFGTGYSSLSYLHTLAVDTLKIDRSFVQSMGVPSTVDGPTPDGLAPTILAMARSLGLQVVAEGIETHQQLQWLTGLGCDLLQGYYLHRPMPPHAVTALLGGRADFSQPAHATLAI